MNGLITLLVMIILSGVAFSMAYLYITNDRVLNLSIGNSTKYNSTMPKCGLKKPIISEFYQNIDFNNLNVIHITIFFRQVHKLFRI